MGLSISGIPFLPGSAFDAVLVVQGSTLISIAVRKQPVMPWQPYDHPV